MSKEHLYIHVPYCKSICHYCDFCHRLYDETSALNWFEAFKKELSLKDLSNLKTLYIGGGTPTSLSEDLLETFLNYLKPYTDGLLEYTIEVNPETMTERKFEILKNAKINRVSIGMQSANDNELKLLGRGHKFSDVKCVVERFKEIGISNISIDLMYSLPFQTMELLKESIQKVLSLEVPHISLYSLTIEENTIFAKKGYQALDEDLEADMYEYIEKVLMEEGYIHYEISNFAKEGYYSKHNLAYWNYNDFIGLSLGASGKEDHKRYTNTRSFKEYLEGHYQDEVIELELKDEMFEEVMMSLRTIFGLDLKRFEKRYKASFFEIYKDAYIKHIDDFKIVDDHLIVKNLELLNSLLIDFLD